MTRIKTTPIASLIIAGLSAASLTGLAAAQDSGFYISGGLNSTTSEQGLTRNTGTNLPTDAATGPANGPSLSTQDQDTGVSLFVGAGYRHDLPNDYFVSVEAFYADESAETLNINNVLVSEVELTESYGIDFRGGLEVTDRFAVYGLLGATNYNFDSNLSYTFAPPTEFVEQDEWALVYGAGVELTLNDRFSTFGEVRLSNDIEFDTPRDRGGVVSDNELDLTVIRSGIRFNF